METPTADQTLEKSDLVLYNYFRSSTSYRVRCALHIKDLSFEYRPIHLTNNGGEQNQKSFRDLNPMGGVPTLLHKTNIISQSSAIIEFLDEAFPNSYQLLPDDPYRRALIRQFCQIINSDMHSVANLRTLQFLENQWSVKEESRIEWIHHWFKNGFFALEEFLKKHSKNYCFGNQLTAADCFLLPLVFTALRFKMDITPFKTVLEISNRLSENELLKKAHPFRQIDTPIELRLI